MYTSKKKLLLLILTIYSFFTCFIMNVFGYALSYNQLTYEWNIPNIYQGRKQVFRMALLHFLIFCSCVFLRIRNKVMKQRQFKSLKTQQSSFHQNNQMDVV